MLSNLTAQQLLSRTATLLELVKLPDVQEPKP